jgi:hypothetical protein
MVGGNMTREEKIKQCEELVVNKECVNLSFECDDCLFFDEFFCDVVDTSERAKAKLKELKGDSMDKKKRITMLVNKLQELTIEVEKLKDEESKVNL